MGFLKVLTQRWKSLLAFLLYSFMSTILEELMAFSSSHCTFSSSSGIPKISAEIFEFWNTLGCFGFLIYTPYISTSELLVTTSDY